MENATRQSVTIHGGGVIEGGIYDKIAVAGGASLKGNIDANRVEISGGAQAAGNLKADVVKTSGSLKMDGNLDAGNVACSGSCKIAGDVKCDDLRVAGSAEIDGTVKGRVIRLAGSARITGDIEAEEFNCGGAIQSDGLLNAGQVRIDLHGDSRVREIGGETIHIISSHKLLTCGRGKGSMEVDTIEGDNIILENTRAKAVRGRKVVIGRGCRIGMLEYSETAQIDEDAVVEQQTHTEG